MRFQCENVERSSLEEGDYTELGTLLGYMDVLPPSVGVALVEEIPESLSLGADVPCLWEDR